MYYNQTTIYQKTYKYFSYKLILFLENFEKKDLLKKDHLDKKNSSEK